MIRNLDISAKQFYPPLLSRNNPHGDVFDVSGMGTEFQFSKSLFASLKTSHGGPLTLTFETPENRLSPRNIHQMGSVRPNKSVQGLGCMKDSLKKTIVAQEKIFRNQASSSKIYLFSLLSHLQILLNSTLLSDSSEINLFFILTVKGSGTPSRIQNSEATDEPTVTGWPCKTFV